MNLLSRRLLSPAAEARIAGSHDCLRAAVDPELGEYDRHLIADRLLADTKLARNGGVVEPLRDAFQHFVLARREVAEQWRCFPIDRTGGFGREEFLDRIQAL